MLKSLCNTTGLSWTDPKNYDEPSESFAGVESEEQVYAQDADRAYGEWVEYTDEDSGTPYYYNVSTGETSWTAPNQY